MQLGIYKITNSPGEERAVRRKGIYDFERDEWVEPTQGRIVARASASPTSEELVGRFDRDPDAKLKTVRPVGEFESDDSTTVTVCDPDISIEEGHERREEMGGPVPTRLEVEYQNEHGVIVVNDDADVPDLSESESDKEIVRRSNWDGYDFEKEININFG